MFDVNVIGKALIDAGGWVFACAVLVGILSALVRGDLVPGAVYRREVARADTATEQLEKSNELGDTLTAQVDTLVKIVGEVFRPRR